MKDLVYLTLRYVGHHRWKTAILVVAITLTVALPVAVQRVVRLYEARLSARAEATPLLIGAKGSRFDLVLHALYFRGRVPDALTMAASDAVLESGLATPTPLHVRFTARGLPIVGTTLEYFDLRGLRVERGTLPIEAGDCVLGSAAAKALGLGPGDRLTSDPESVFRLTGKVLRMRVAGVLAEAGTPDDGAVFVDLKTAWVLEGIGHGHEDVTDEDADDAVVLQRKEGVVVANEALVRYEEITPENLESFHFHGEREDFPITAVIAWPADLASETILRGRYVGPDAAAQALVPTEVVAELFGLVFRAKRFFDAQVGLVAVSTLLFLSLIVLLSIRLRASERETLHKIGCSRGAVAWMHAIELGLVFALSAGLAAAASWAAVAQAPRILGWLVS